MSIQIVSCPVCLDLFSSKPPHRPKMLLCGHSTCEECIHQWANRNNPALVQCPHCRRQFNGLALDDIPINFTLLEVLDNVGSLLGKRKDTTTANGSDDDVSKKSKTEAKCEITNGLCDQPATHRCLECAEGNQFMCKDHLFQHASFSSHKTHHPIRIDDLPSSPSTSSSSSSTLLKARITCSDHIGQAVTIHCWDCSKAVCDRCGLFGHKTHSYSEIHQAADRMKRDLEDRKTKMEEVIERWKKLNKEVERKTTMIETKEEEMLKMTDAMCDTMREAVEEWRVSMKRRVVETVKQDKAKLKEVGQRLEEEIGEGETMRGEIESLISKREAKRTKDDDGKGGDGKAEEEEERMDVISFVCLGGESCRRYKELMKEGDEKKIIDVDDDDDNDDDSNDEDDDDDDSDSTIVANIATTEDYGGERDVLRIDSKKMTEATMLMEEGLRRVAVGCLKRMEDEDDETVDLESNNDDNNNDNKKKMSSLRKTVSTLFDRPDRRFVIDGYVQHGDEVFGVAWSKDGESLYVTAGGEKAGIRKINIETGETIKTIGKSVGSPGSIITTATKGNIYVTSRQTNKMYLVSATSGKILQEIGSTQGDGDGQFNWPYAVCVVDEWNEVYVVDTDNHRIQVFDMRDGKFIRKFGAKGDDPGQLDSPSGIAVDASAGLIFVSEVNNYRVQVFDRDGKSIRMFGSFGSEDGELNCPQGLALDTESKMVVIADYDNHRLCLFDYEGRFYGSAKSVAMQNPTFVSRRADGRFAISSDKHRGVFFGRILDSR